MAQIKDPKYIIQCMHEKSMKFYRVYDSAGKQLDFSQESELTVEEAAAKLERTLSQLDGLVSIKISQKSNTEKGEGNSKGTDLHFTVMLGSGNPAQIQGIGGTSAADIKAMVTEAVNEAKRDWEKDLEIQRLKDELAEAKETNPIVEQVLGALPGLFGAMSGTPPAQALAGFQDDAQAERQARLTAAIRKLARHDKQYLEHLEMIGNLAETKPLVFAGAIKKLEGLA